MTNYFKVHDADSAIVYNGSSAVWTSNTPVTGYTFYVASTTTVIWVDPVTGTAVAGEPYGGPDVPPLAIAASLPDVFIDVNQTWDFTNHVWFYDKPYLKSLVFPFRVTSQDAGVVISGKLMPTDADALGTMAMLVHQLNQEDPTDDRAVTLADNFNSVLTNSATLTTYDVVMQHIQNHVDAEKAVHDLIDSVTLTDPNDIGSAWDTAIAAAIATPSTRAAAPTLSVTASQVSDWNTAVDARISAQKAANSGLATLDSGGKIPTLQLPAIAITNIFTVSSQVAQLALTAQTGDVAVRTDQSLSYVNNGGTAGTMADWTQLLFPSGGVSSVNTKTGAVTLTTSDITEGTNLYYTDSRARAAARMYSGTTAKTGYFPWCGTATVASGNAVFQLTSDGTSSGTALFPTGPDLNSLMFRADNEASGVVTYGLPVLSNSNKTLTIPVNKSTGTTVALVGLTLLTAPVAANGSVIKALILGN